MRIVLFVLLAVGAVRARPADERNGCAQDDLYTAIQRNGSEFCTKLLDPDCYTAISTPAEYTTYDSGKLSSYCSCVFESCHHKTSTSTSTSIWTLLPTTSSTTETPTETWSKASPVITIPLNTTSMTVPDSWPTETPPPEQTWIPSNSTLLTRTMSTIPENSTITIIPAPTSSTTPGTISITIIPGNATTSATSLPWTSTPTVVATPISAANFTGVSRGPAPSALVCHSLPESHDGESHVASLQNEDIRQQNQSLAFPFVGSVNFDSDGITPLYLSVRDVAKGSHRIDVSSSTAVTIFDSKNNSLRIDTVGIHFATQSCNLTVSYLVDNMYAQLAQQSHEMCSLGPKTLLAADQRFVQTLFLSDQCHDPVKQQIHQYPELRLADSHCATVGVDERNGTWVFNCVWKGPGSTSQRCIAALEREAIEFLLYDPFNGGCADVSSVVTLLDASAQDIFNGEALKTELYNQVGNSSELRIEVDEIVVFYLQLWEMLKSTLSKTRGLNPGRGSNLRQYLDTYNAYRSFADDACTSLNSSHAPAILSLHAGSSFIPSLASFDEIPPVDIPIPAKVQDPGKVACCPNGGVAATSTDTGACAYPTSALVPGTSCVCGKTAGGADVAFKYRQCDNFVSQCEADSDCDDAGYAGFMCLIGSCCGKGVCFDPYECSRSSVPLVPGSV